MKLFISFLIWMFMFIPVVILSLPVVAVLLLTSWDGSTTIFGNSKYPRGHGNPHLVHDNWLGQWIFLCFRNPVSNYGHWAFPRGLAASKFYWREQNKVGPLTIDYGWKGPGGTPPYTFIFRPHL